MLRFEKHDTYNKEKKKIDRKIDKKKINWKKKLIPWLSDLHVIWLNHSFKF